MRTFFNSLLLLVFLIPATLFAQTSVSGTVTDEANGLPLPGVNVLVKGTTTGASTDFDGNYSLSLNNGDVVVFSYLGYKSKEVIYSGGSRLDVTLNEDAAQLDEVVLIGYGATTKQDATGAVEKINDERFNKGAIVSPETLLAGKSAGVRVTSGGGAAGEGSEIRIRGGASLSANNSPLIVIDGLPLDQRGGAQGTRNSLSAINPDDIEDFVVLKDASATAIYGSRASNGVILITTKKGSANAPLTVEYDLKASAASNINELDVLTADQYRGLSSISSEFNPALLGDANTNWQDQIYQTAIGAIHNLTVSKGYENFNFRVNYNHVSQQGTLLRDLYERNALNASFVQRLFDNDLKLTLTTRGILDEFFFTDQGAIGAAAQFDPTQPVRNPDGSLFQYSQIGNANLAPVNPLTLLLENQNRSNIKRFISNFNIDYRFRFLPDLKFNLNAGIDYAENDGAQFNVANPNNPGAFAFQNFYSGLNRNTLLDFYFNYKTNVESINTIVDLTAGHSYQEFYIRSDRTATGAGGVLNTFPTVINRNALESYFARASFDISDRYLISATFRRDGSSRFSPAGRWGNFPGVSVGWKIMNEPFMANSFFSNLKLRGGWGVTGQQEIGPNYGYLGVYTPALNDQVSAQFGNQFVDPLRPEAFDENLTWESTTQYNVGLDFGLFNNRLTGSIDGYYRETEDLLATIPVAAGSNLSDFLTTNVGATTSKGLELSLNGVLAKSENLNWDVNFNFTLQENEITKLNLSGDPNFFIPQGGIAGGVGNTIQLWRPGLDPLTFFVWRQVYNNQNNPIEGAYVDTNADNQITEADRQAYKKATPDAFIGLTNNFQYKNFDLSFTFRGSFGNYVYNNVASDRGNLAVVLDAPGDFQPNAHQSVLATNFRSQNLFSDYYLQRADFLRLDNATIGYNIPMEKVNLRVSLTGTNLFVITEYDGLDPEIANGIDNNFYPRARTFVLGLNFKF
ncbi:SusC/RagA family TonB-linked outer membrane protein [Paucihalobacter ruber]|uniref:SusC/RagA family TonB-linked outer membrane protein n=1 Tax=Paucihalobacter ruber TaxID=2567861 RepID=A0A506PEB0_9FLAO|nr:SusC/RagA family TonB-linked outer membrane protein [Paucihalobacter ruber]TPV31848.1 SusC/RagA family TonB-linked outer membrane protein [Paucihalobacter ruber]